jgi:foldase protein PrsA
MVRENLYNSLINEELIKDYVQENSDYEPPTEEVQTAYDEFMNQNKEDEEKMTYYEENGIDEAFLKNEIKGQLYAQQFQEILKEEVENNGDALEEAYANEVVQVKASHILTKDNPQAAVVLEKLKAGEDFAALAEEYSQDPGSASNGGDLGYVSKGEMVPEFEQAAFNLEVGELSEVVQSQFGYHVIKVSEKRTINDLIEAGESQEKIDQYKQEVLNAKIQEIYQQKLAELTDAAEIERYLSFENEETEEDIEENIEEENTEG